MSEEDHLSSDGKYREIEDRIVNLLDTFDGKEQLEKRRAKIAQVAEVAKDIKKWGWADKKWKLCARPGIWFSTTQGQAIQANTEGCMLSVQMLGYEIGKLEIDRAAESESRYVFIPLKRFNPKRERWDWSRKTKDGMEIREFLKTLPEKEKWGVKVVQEREIQWQLANQLDKVTKDPFRMLSTVRWVGCPTEIGVSLTNNGMLGTGTIDLLVRRRGSGQQGAQFLVFEVKRPGVKDVESALRQAIYYALALQIEANFDGTTQESYRAAFGSKKNAELVFGAVIVMEDTKSNREAGEKALKAFNLHKVPKHNPKVDRLGMLLYKCKWNDKNKPQAYDWTWLEGWDPRKNP